MAKADNNVFLSHVTGTIGKQMTIKQRGGSTIISKTPKKSKKKPTKAQLVTQEKFSRAVSYAKKVEADPDMKSAYEAAAQPGQNGFNMALKDAYNAPEIKDISVTGKTVTVRAIDDFRVFQVVVSVYNAKDTLVEKGNALLGRNGKDWTYTATKDIKTGRIQAMAEDLPGNKTYSEISI